MKKEYLNEENYNNTKNKIVIIAVVILVLGLGIGGFLIYNGLKSPSSKSLEELTEELAAKKTALQEKGVEYNAFTNYEDGEAYDLKIISQAMDPSFSYCSFDEYKNNAITSEYCAVKNKSSSVGSFSSIAFGVVVIVGTLGASASVYMIAKRREILAFTAQQVMPIAQEGAEKMAPTAGKVAKEVAKGIKEGLRDDE